MRDDRAAILPPPISEERDYIVSQIKANTAASFLARLAQYAADKVGGDHEADEVREHQGEVCR
jgi:hypothetical protein